MLPVCIICCECSLKTLTMWGDSANRSCEWKQSSTQLYAEWKDLNHRTRWCAECCAKHSQPRKDHYSSKSTQKAQHNNNACHNVPHPGQPSARSRRDCMTNWITCSYQPLCAIISFTLICMTVHPILSHIDQNLPAYISLCITNKVYKHKNMFNVDLNTFRFASHGWLVTSTTFSFSHVNFNLVISTLFHADMPLKSKLNHHDLFNSSV